MTYLKRNGWQIAILLLLLWQTFKPQHTVSNATVTQKIQSVPKIENQTKVTIPKVAAKDISQAIAKGISLDSLYAHLLRLQTQSVSNNHYHVTNVIDSNITVLNGIDSTTDITISHDTVTDEKGTVRYAIIHEGTLHGVYFDVDYSVPAVVKEMTDKKNTINNSFAVTSSMRIGLNDLDFSVGGMYRYKKYGIKYEYGILSNSHQIGFLRHFQW